MSAHESRIKTFCENTLAFLDVWSPILHGRVKPSAVCAVLNARTSACDKNCPEVVVIFELIRHCATLHWRHLHRCVTVNKVLWPALRTRELASGFSDFVDKRHYCLYKRPWHLLIIKCPKPLRKAHIRGPITASAF